MKALTIKPQWAALIAAGLKPIENRTWRTTHRGPLLIHASGRLEVSREEWEGIVEVAKPQAAAPTWEDLQAMCGRLLCRVDVVDCVPVAELPEGLRGHWTAQGPWCWILKNPAVLVDQVAVKGRLMLWEFAKPQAEEKIVGNAT